jgi:hypothetical protein
MRKERKQHASLLTVRKKLYSALAMLLVSSIMLVSSSYAWLVLSSAPEITGIQTQVGANGSLEVALLDTDTYNNVGLITDADIDESADDIVASSNLSWGNLVNLSDSSYGLSNIVLMPARLNIKENGKDEDGNTQYKVGQVLLKTPSYGEDGRIQSLQEIAVSSVYSGSGFPADGNTSYGVRAIGTSSEQSTYQLGIIAARNAISTYTSAARNAASNALNTTGTAIANVVMEHALNSSTESYDAEDIQALLDLAEGLKTALEDVESALRQVYATYIVSNQYTAPANWDYEAALTEINTAELSDLQAKYPDTGVTGMANYVLKLLADETKVDNAISACKEMLETDGSYTWAQISATMSPLVDYDKMTMGGYTVDDIKKMKDAGDMDSLFSVIMGSGMTITVPSGSGIVSDIADFAGDYTAKVTIEEISYGDYHLTDVSASMATATEENPVYLVNCSRVMSKIQAAEGDGSSTITDFFGYALDLAFRTNASGSNLLLQTDTENRVYTGSSENTGIQGGGSYMEFTTGSGISATKMIKLMSAVRVVFMDQDNNILAIGALDTTLGKDAYTVLSDEEKTATGKYAVLNSGMVQQTSDYIDYTAYSTLDGNETAVTFDKENLTIRAELYLYDFSMTKNSAGGLTGGLTLGAKKSTAEITALTENDAKIVTAMVYLDGSFVNNTMVASDSQYSMTGTLNLQFSSDATLIPAENSDLRTGKTTTEESKQGDSKTESQGTTVEGSSGSETENQTNTVEGSSESGTEN